MSKGKNYNNFYKKKEEPIKEVAEVSYDNKTEEIVTEEEVSEAPVEEEKTEEPEVEMPKTTLKVANTKKVNFRKAPNKNANIISVLSEGTEVKMIGRPMPEWYEVEVNNQIGFIMAQYLK